MNQATASVLLDLLQIVSEVVEGRTPPTDIKAHIKIVEQRIMLLQGGSDGV